MLTLEWWCGGVGVLTGVVMNNHMSRGNGKEKDGQMIGSEAVRHY